MPYPRRMSEPTPPPHHGIDYLELPATDLPAAKAFYGAAFGWSFQDYGPSYVGFVDHRRGEREAGGLTQVETVSGGGPLVVLWSDDLEATLTAVEAAGGSIVKPIFGFPGGRRFHFRDPSGLELAVWSHHA